MKGFTLFALAAIALFPMLVFAQIWLWRHALMPVAPGLLTPTFWQMVGVDLLIGGVMSPAFRR